MYENKWNDIKEEGRKNSVEEKSEKKILLPVTMIEKITKMMIIAAWRKMI